jgi:hypothetical protein
MSLSNGTIPWIASRQGIEKCNMDNEVTEFIHAVPAQLSQASSWQHVSVFFMRIFPWPFNHNSALLCPVCLHLQHSDYYMISFECGCVQVATIASLLPRLMVTYIWKAKHQVMFLVKHLLCIFVQAISLSLFLILVTSNIITSTLDTRERNYVHMFLEVSP